MTFDDFYYIPAAMISHWTVCPPLQPSRFCSPAALQVSSTFYQTFLALQQALVQQPSPSTPAFSGSVTFSTDKTQRA